MGIIKDLLSGKEQIFANGKIIAKPFKGLRAADFPTYASTQKELEELPVVVSCDGKLFINSAMSGYEKLIEWCQVLINTQKYEIEKKRKELKRKAPYTKKIESLPIDDPKAPNMIFAFLMEQELTRRELERKYYIARK